MKNTKYIITILLLFVSSFGYAQNSLTGHVMTPDEAATAAGELGLAMPFVNVYWMNTTVGAVTDENGYFELERPAEQDGLVISYVGYENDTVFVGELTQVIVLLQRNNLLEEVAITATQSDTYIDRLDPLKTEQITAAELCKAACCNLSESFETNASVDVETTDGVSGAKEIRMLGLDGVYMQLLTEGLPSMRGLGTTYGLSYIPGFWISSIQVSKGAGSVVNGFGSITGQINLEYFKPYQSERLFVNLFGNSMGRMEATVNTAHRFNEKLSTHLMLYGSFFDNKNSVHADYNKDGFYDMPRIKAGGLMHRWSYRTKKMVLNYGVKLLKDDRRGGQLSFDSDKARTVDNGYGLGINTTRAELFGKTGFMFKKEGQSIGLMWNAIYHDQSSFFGLKEYTGLQKSLWFNLIYQMNGFTSKDVWKLGTSYLYDDIKESYTFDTHRKEPVPGIFTEYAWVNDQFTVVAGMRADYLKDYPVFFSPRLHLKYDINPEMALRASVGQGFRLPNIFAENGSILASSRELVQVGSIEPERGWNVGFNFTHRFNLFNKGGYYTLDAYRTDFSEQLIADTYSNPQQIRFYSLDGASFANSLQAEVNYELLEGFEMKLAWKYDDVRRTYEGELQRMPMQSRHKGLVNLAYTTPNEKWNMHASMQWHGKKQLTLIGDASALQYAPSFTMFSAQLNYHVGKFEFYLGGENLGNFRQLDPIQGANDPFGSSFDATNVWGPLVGRRIYAGLRIRLPYKDETASL